MLFAKKKDFKDKIFLFQPEIVSIFTMAIMLFCIPESFKENISHQFFDYKITIKRLFFE